jgi:hypothetical protein
MGYLPSHCITAVILLSPKRSLQYLRDWFFSKIGFFDLLTIKKYVSYPCVHFTVTGMSSFVSWVCLSLKFRFLNEQNYRLLDSVFEREKLLVI